MVPDNILKELMVMDPRSACDELLEQRNDARANARVLAHAYSMDNRPPRRVVEAALAYPVIPTTKKVRK